MTDFALPLKASGEIGVVRLSGRAIESEAAIPIEAKTTMMVRKWRPGDSEPYEIVHISEDGDAYAERRDGTSYHYDWKARGEDWPFPKKE